GSTDRHAQDPLAPGRCRDRPRRARQAPAQPPPGQLSARAAALPARGRARGGERGRGVAPYPAPARRAHHPAGHPDLRHPRARLQVDARRGSS
ncbi:MAG: Heme biosynthesis protein related to NirD and NirG / Heme biosynthesis protein related to NirL and NirH, partial [uncultured Solirubrobacterales bacterium]